MKSEMGIINILYDMFSTLLDSKLFSLFAGVILGAVFNGVWNDLRAALLNVSDIWEKYWKHLNNGSLSKRELQQFKNDKWSILAKDLINDTSHSLWHYPHNRIWLTNHYVMLRCSWKQICIRIELWWLKKHMSYIDWKLCRIKRKEVSYNVKLVCKGIEEYNKQQQALLNKKIENFWERGWNEIRQMNSSR